MKTPLTSRSTGRFFVLLGLAGFLSVEVGSAQILNGSFELNFSGWTRNAGVYIIGHPPAQPIGVDGGYSADLGGAEIVGAKLSQSFFAIPNAEYVISFATAANGAGRPGLVSAVEASIRSEEGTLLAAQTYTNVSEDFVLGTNGFVLQTLPFRAPSTASVVTLTFADISPNNGLGVDVALDDVKAKVTSVSTISEVQTNGSFELGFLGWNHNAGVYIIGHPPGQPIGTEGGHSADVGGGEVVGAILSQAFPLVPGATYEITFDTMANGAGTGGLTSVVDVVVRVQEGESLASGSFTNVSLDMVPVGDAGFTPRRLTFQAPSADPTNATLSFADISPNNGKGVDVAIDNVRIRAILPSSYLGIRPYPGITLYGVIGTRYRIEYVEFIATPAPSQWMLLTNLTLLENPTLYVDVTAPLQTPRYYRAIVEP